MSKRYDHVRIATEVAARVLADLSEDSLVEAAGHIWESFELYRSYREMSVYIRTTQDGPLREVAIIDHDQRMMGSDILPSYQMPDSIGLRSTPLTLFTGQWETWIPLPIAEQVIGYLVLSRVAEDTHMGDALWVSCAPILALGFWQHRETAAREQSLRLLRGVTRLSRLIGESQDLDVLLCGYVQMSVELLGFDRATFFLYASDGRKVTQVWYAALGCSPGLLIPSPHPPFDASEPMQVLDRPIVWVPFYRQGIRVAAVVVDNLFSDERVPSGALEAMIDLGGQIVLALENVHLLASLHESSMRDDLTKLLRVGSFEEQTSLALDVLVAEKRQASLLLLDIDRFKQVNDVYGHAIGDIALTHVAAMIRDTLHTGEWAGRIGDDEFVIFLPDVAKAEGLLRAATLARLIANHKIVLDDGRELTLSVSIGQASCPEDGTNLRGLMKVSDERMYDCKRSTA